MKANYVAFEAEVLSLVEEDVITSSTPDFTDTNGDNGVWFPGSEGGNSQWS